MPDVVRTIAFVTFITVFQCALMLAILYVVHFRPQARPESSTAIRRWFARLLQSHRLLAAVLIVVVAVAVGLGATAILSLTGFPTDWMAAISVTLGTALGLAIYSVWWRPHGTVED